MAEQSSVCIPLSSGPIKVPSYLQMDLTSPWNVGALQSVALDTITLPSRLRAGRSTLQQLEEIINSTGQRRLAKLELSVADPDVLSARPPSNVAHAEKVRSSVSTERSDDVDDDQIDFDMDLFTKEYRASPVNPAKREHIFGRLEVDRGDWSLPSTDNIDPHDRFNDGPVVQRYAILPTQSHLCIVGMDIGVLWTGPSTDRRLLVKQICRSSIVPAPLQLPFYLRCRVGARGKVRRACRFIDKHSRCWAAPHA
jgi:hypothetical protein